jgi:hypothetical protein
MAVWHITEDIISEADDTLQTGRWINGKAPAPNTKPEEFRLLDDDKNVYFGGIVYLEAHDTGFEPLWDWAMPGWGCTEIQYKHPSTGAWVTL